MFAASNTSAAKTTGPSPTILATYGFFLLGALSVHHLIAEGEFSSILTMSVMCQCLAFALLALQVISVGNADGISTRALSLDALALACRLSSTLWLNGYLPMDASGDWVFQAIDICSLMLVVGLLCSVLRTGRSEEMREKDSLPVGSLTVGSFALAFVLHADMNSRPIFDSLWMAGLFLSTVSILPQLWLIVRTGGKVQAFTSHHIATLAFSRMLSGVFMWYARHDITCQPWVEGYNHAIWAILGTHLVHVVLLADYMYYYIRAMVRGGVACVLDLADDLGV